MARNNARSVSSHRSRSTSSPMCHTPRHQGKRPHSPTPKRQSSQRRPTPYRARSTSREMKALSNTPHSPGKVAPRRSSRRRRSTSSKHRSVSSKSRSVSVKRKQTKSKSPGRFRGRKGSKGKRPSSAKRRSLSKKVHGAKTKRRSTSKNGSKFVSKPSRKRSLKRRSVSKKPKEAKSKSRSASRTGAIKLHRAGPVRGRSIAKGKRPSTGISKKPKGKPTNKKVVKSKSPGRYRGRSHHAYNLRPLASRR